MTESVFLSPKSIAIVGASDKEGSVGRAITSNIMKGYKGTIYPISPTRETVFDKKAYKSVLDVPGKIDLAVVVTKNTVNQLNHEFAINNEQLRVLAQEAWLLIPKIPQLEIKWIPRKENLAGKMLGS